MNTVNTVTKYLMIYLSSGNTRYLISNIWNCKVTNYLLFTASNISVKTIQIMVYFKIMTASINFL